jgi:hypothetical protein
MVTSEGRVRVQALTAWRRSSVAALRSRGLCRAAAQARLPEPTNNTRKQFAPCFGVLQVECAEVQFLIDQVVQCELEGAGLDLLFEYDRDDYDHDDQAVALGGRWRLRTNAFFSGPPAQTYSVWSQLPLA